MISFNPLGLLAIPIIALVFWVGDKIWYSETLFRIFCKFDNLKYALEKRQKKKKGGENSGQKEENNGDTRP